MAKLRIPVSAEDYAEGSADAPLTLVEYGDYECPHCGRAYPIVKQLQKTFGNKLRFIYRNFPISEAHPHAARAAAAAEAAGRQGKFWPMHDRLFEHQQHLDTASLKKYAADIGLNAKTFIADLESDSAADRVAADFEGGVRSGVNGTPTFFLNGVRVDSGFDYESLADALRAAHP